MVGDLEGEDVRREEQRRHHDRLQRHSTRHHWKYLDEFVSMLERPNRRRQ
jgi:hypothetical protein